jgi:elongation factor P
VQYVPASFLYSDGEGFHFMDESSYEQFMFTGEQVGDDQGYLKEGVSLQILKVQRRARLAATAAVRRTRRDRNRTRHARRYGRGRREQKGQLETGLSVNLPLFIKEGETVRVNTQTGEVAGRA